MTTTRSDGVTVWWIYFVLCKNGRVYTGISPDPGKRFSQHMRRLSAHMRINGPVALLGARPVGCYGEAAVLERRIKRLSSSDKEAIANSFEPYTAGSGQSTSNSDGDPLLRRP